MRERSCSPPLSYRTLRVERMAPPRPGWWAVGSGEAAPWWARVPADPRPWWKPDCSFADGGELRLALGAVGFVVAAFLLAAAEARGLFDEEGEGVAWDVWWRFVEGWGALLAFYLTSYGLSLTLESAALARSDSSSSRVAALMRDHAPWSDRLAAQLDAPDPYAALLDGPRPRPCRPRPCRRAHGGEGAEAAAAAAACDWLHRRFVEALLPAMVFDVVSEAVALRALQPAATVRLWRQWFAAPLMRRARAAAEPFWDKATRQYFDQVLFAARPPPAPPCWRVAAEYPLRVLNAVVVLLVLAVSAYLLAEYARGALSAGGALARWIDALGSLYTGLFALLIGFDYATVRSDIDAQLTQEENRRVEAAALAAFPASVWATVQVRPHDPALQALRALDPSRLCTPCRRYAGGGGGGGGGGSPGEVVYTLWLFAALMDSVEARLGFRALAANEAREVASWFAAAPFMNGLWAARGATEYRPRTRAAVAALLPPDHCAQVAAWQRHVAELHARQCRDARARGLPSRSPHTTSSSLLAPHTHGPDGADSGESVG